MATRGTISQWVKSKGGDAKFFNLRMGDALTLGFFGEGKEDGEEFL